MTYPSSHLVPYLKNIFPFADKICYAEREFLYEFYQNEIKLFNIKFHSSGKWSYSWHTGGKMKFNSLEECIEYLKWALRDRIKEAKNVSHNGN